MRMLPALLTLLTASCGLPPGYGTEAPEALRNTAKPTRVTRYQLTVATFPDQPTAESAFPISYTYDLIFLATMPSRFPAGAHVAAFELTGPSGAIYQRLEVPFTGTSVWTTVPVAGTMIEQYAMIGDWTVEVFVDDAPAAQMRASFSLH